MRLAQMLMKLHGGSGRRPQGHIWTGKHRIAHGIYPRSLAVLTRELEREEKNLFYLRHPYLTLEQERGACKELKKQEQWINQFRVRNTARKVKPSVTMEMRLSHLNHSEAWDV